MTHSLTLTQKWVLALTSLVSLMVALDSLVVTTALGAIRLDLHASIADLEWTVNAYNLSFAVLLMTGAVPADRFGRRRLLLIGLSLFISASAACALAPSVGALIAARTVQGAGRGADHAPAARAAQRAVPAEAASLGDRHLQRDHGGSPWSEGHSSAARSPRASPGAGSSGSTSRSASS